MSRSETVAGRVGAALSTSVLMSVALTSVAQTLVENESGIGVESLMQSVVQIGGPTAVGALAACAIVKINTAEDLKYQKLLSRGAIAGGVAAAVLVLSGGIPSQVDAQLLSLIALVGGATAVGSVLAFDWNNIFPQ